MGIYQTPSDSNIQISDITTNDVSSSAHGFAPKLWASAWTSWTPTFTNMSVSNSTVTAKYLQQGKGIWFHLSVVLAGGDKPSGSVSFTLPVTAVSYSGTSTLPIIGNAQYFITNAYGGFVVYSNTTTVNFNVWNTSSTYATANNISATVPGTFTNGSELHASGYYEAA